MAGGSGTRFWPKSRTSFPKQFLTLGGPRTLLRQTFDRVVDLVGKEQIYIVTAAQHAEHAREAVPELPPDHVLVEPIGRNTAPCIGWATARITGLDPDARIAVLPSDHYIADERAFRSHLEAAFEAAGDRIVLFGIVPTHPETGYGYIRRGIELATSIGMPILGVERFVEKPDRETAIGYLAEQRYLWNSGMFVFPGRLMAAEIARLLPDLHRGLEELMKTPSALEKIYPSLPSISIDYGVMERSQHIAVLPATFGWSDVGSWDAVMAIETPDEHGNVVRGDAVLVDVKNTLVEAQAGRLVAAVDVGDLIIVDTKDALLIVRRGESQRVKHIVDALKAKKRDDLL
jgi:mannose-1-phosphate guanylyltransferase